jgi:hypothetical protein
MRRGCHSSCIYLNLWFRVLRKKVLLYPVRMYFSPVISLRGSWNPCWLSIRMPLPIRESGPNLMNHGKPVAMYDRVGWLKLVTFLGMN